MEAEIISYPLFYKDLADAGIEWKEAYLKEDDHSYHFTDGTVIKVSSVSALKATLKTFDLTPEQCVANAKPHSKYYGANPEEVRKAWKEKADKGKENGHRIHAILEYMHKGKRYEKTAFDTKLRTLFSPIYNRIKTYGTVYFETPVILPIYRDFMGQRVTINTIIAENKKEERNIYDNMLRQARLKMFNVGLGGTLDILVIDWEKKVFYIHDIKTDIEIRDSNKPFPKPMPEPFNHMIDCEIELYSIQIFLYALMVEVITGFKFIHEKSSIIWFDQTKEKFKVYLIKNRRKEAILLIKKFFEI